MSGKRIYWDINLITSNPLVVRVMGGCEELETESKLISTCYCLAIIANNLQGCTATVTPIPEYTMDHDGVIVSMYMAFMNESDMKKFLNNALVCIAKLK